MKILTLNINSIRAHIESFLEILRKGEYDTIMVQELKVENANFPHMLFDEFGYNVKVFGQKSWNGVATFSKYSIEDVTLGLPNYADTHARFLECVVDGRVRLINVYMPNGDYHLFVGKMLAKNMVVDARGSGGKGISVVADQRGHGTVQKNGQCALVSGIVDLVHRRDRHKSVTRGHISDG